MYWFPIVALTNYHQLSDLKHKFIILSFGAQKSEMNLTELKSMCKQGVLFPRSSRRQRFFAFLMVYYRSCPHFLAQSPFLHLQRQQWQIESFSHHINLTLHPLSHLPLTIARKGSLLFQAHVLGSAWILQGNNLCNSRSLM